MIEIRLRDGLGVRQIARLLGGSPGTISEEIKRHGDGAGYVAQTAQTQAAPGRRLCGRKPRRCSEG